MRLQKLFAIGLSAICLSACGNSMTVDTATTDELCRQWGQSLPARSRSDTPTTQGEIQTAYARFGLSCPDHTHLIP